MPEDLEKLRNDALEEAAAEIDCGCPNHDRVVECTSKADRWRLCQHSNCAAELADDIRKLKRGLNERP